MNESTNMFVDVIQSLRSCATVSVNVDAKPSASTNGISISRMKMNQMINAYSMMYKIVHQCWSNLPDPPCNEKTFVFMWVIASDDYNVNHGTIAWEGSNPNTFVHLWSIVDRIRIPLENANMAWVVGTRNCADYCKTTGMNGPLDTHMYPHENVTPQQITLMSKDVNAMRYVNVSTEFCSFYDFNMSTITIPVKKVITASEMEEANSTIARRASPGSSS